MIVEIKNEKIELKQTMRSMMFFEKIQNKPFTIENISDVIIYFYCCIISSKKDIDLDINDFFDWLDLNQNVFVDFNNWLTLEAEKTQQLSGTPSKKKKKK